MVDFDSSWVVGASLPFRWPKDEVPFFQFRCVIGNSTIAHTYSISFTGTL